MKSSVHAGRESGFAFSKALPPVLRHRSFARFMGGSAMSNVGGWMQNVTVPYALYQMTDSATWVGVAAAAQYLPAVPLAPLAGALADRCDRRRVLIFALLLQAACTAGLLASWVLWDGPWPLLVFVSIGGTSLMVTAATQQAFVSDLVPEREMLAALTLNSAQSNLARAVGPGLAGLILAAGGPSWALFVNLLTYGALFAALIRIDVEIDAATGVDARTSGATEAGVLRSFGDALRMSARRKNVRSALVLTIVAGAGAFPTFQLAAVLARDVYDVGATGFGVLTGSFGVGAIVGAALLARLGTGRSRRRILRASLSGLTGALALFGITKSFNVAVVCLAGVGGFALVVIAVLNTTVQSATDRTRRGSVLAVWIVTYNLAYAAGALVMGVLADDYGAPAAVMAGAVAVGVGLLWTIVYPSTLSRLDDAPPYG